MPMDRSVFWIAQKPNLTLTIRYDGEKNARSIIIVHSSPFIMNLFLRLRAIILLASNNQTFILSELKVNWHFIRFFFFSTCRSVKKTNRIGMRFQWSAVKWRIQLNLWPLCNKYKPHTKRMLATYFQDWIDFGIIFGRFFSLSSYF